MPSNRADTLTNISTCTDVSSRRVIHRFTHRTREIPAAERFIYQADFRCWRNRLILIASRLFGKENTVKSNEETLRRTCFRRQLTARCNRRRALATGESRTKFWLNTLVAESLNFMARWSNGRREEGAGADRKLSPR